MYRIFHLEAAEYRVFSSEHGTFSRIYHILGHKISLGKFKKIEIISNIFSETQYYETRKQLRNKHLEAKQYATKESMDHWRNQRGNKKIPGDKWKQKHSNPKSMGCSKSSSKREVYSNTSLLQEAWKTQINNPNLYLKELEKEE